MFFVAKLSRFAVGNPAPQERPSDSASVPPQGGEVVTRLFLTA